MDRRAAADAVKRRLARLDLADRAESRLDAMSHGNQQRVQLAAALVYDPVAVVLDEPFAGLDPLGVESLSRGDPVASRGRPSELKRTGAAHASRRGFATRNAL
jgi:ABC-type uncharacterized transport system ATPase subunit